MSANITPEDQARADALRQQARDSQRRSHESWERSDTDGFVSQWAGNITAAELELKAQLIEQGGVVETDALFDLEGNYVLAKWVHTEFGGAWGIMDPDNPSGRFLGWFNESKAKNPETARKNNARKGYYVGRIKAKGYVKIVGGGTGLAGAASCYPAMLVWRDENNGGAPIVTEIIDNGQGN